MKRILLNNKAHRDRRLGSVAEERGHDTENGRPLPSLCSNLTRFTMEHLVKRGWVSSPGSREDAQNVSRNWEHTHGCPLAMPFM
jgi:hypothetical protein